MREIVASVVPVFVYIVVVLFGILNLLRWHVEDALETIKTLNTTPFQMKGRRLQTCSEAI